MDGLRVNQELALSSGTLGEGRGHNFHNKTSPTATAKIAPTSSRKVFVGLVIVLGWRPEMAVQVHACEKSCECQQASHGQQAQFGISSGNSWHRTFWECAREGIAEVELSDTSTLLHLVLGPILSVV